METTEIIFAHGHKNIKATHRSTLEITTENQLSNRGNCIIAVAADKAIADLSFKLKESMLNKKAKITVSIEAGEVSEVVSAFGSPLLILTHPTDSVVRKSSYICSRTLAIKADKAACDLSRKLLKKLRNPKQRVKITITVKV